MWHQKLHSAMTEMGFKLVECDNSIWVFLKGKTRIIVCVYVDDITITGESKSEVKWVKEFWNFIALRVKIGNKQVSKVWH